MGRCGSPNTRLNLPVSISELEIITCPRWTIYISTFHRQPHTALGTSRPLHSSRRPFNLIERIMAEVASSSTADATTAQGKQHAVKPEKPDEEQYKAALAKAEKEHTAAQEKLVGICYFNCTLSS